VAKTVQRKFFEEGLIFEGSCAFVTAIACSPRIRRDIPSLVEVHNDIIALRSIRDAERRRGLRRWRRDDEELIVQLSGGKARSVGAWIIEPNAGRFLKKAAKNPTATLIRLLQEDEEGDEDLDATIENLHTGREIVTALEIRESYSVPNSIGHVCAVLPDEAIASDPEISRTARVWKEIRRLKQSAMHLVVNTHTMIRWGSLFVAPGVYLVSGDDIAKYANEPHSEYGRSTAGLSFVLTRQD
jgi:hypothetical protein